MRTKEFTQFGGVAGRLAREAISVRSLVSGIFVGFVLVAGTIVLALARVESAVMLFHQVVIALALARFAVNGQYGEWNGTVLSQAGGPWSYVASVALRFLALSAVWVLPLFLVGLRSAPVGPQELLTDRTSLALTLLYFAGATWTPPLFMIVAISANQFGDVFDRRYWAALFRGRFDDVLAIYAVHTGTVGVAIFFVLPLVAAAFIAQPGFGLFVVVLLAPFVLGMTLSLGGRLCGFFALGDLPDSRAPSPGMVPAAPPAASKGPANRPGVEHPPLPIEAAMGRHATDPDGAIRALEEMRASVGESPAVLRALCLCLYRSGKLDRALQTAREAIPRCLDADQAQLAADLFKELRGHVDAIGVTGEQLLAIAASLAARGELSSAAAAYSIVVRDDPAETRAVKGLLHVAETFLRVKANAPAALRVYRFLLDRCPGSPLAEFMREGLAEAERAAEHAREPVTA